MTIHVDITEDGTRLSELFAAALRGEKVILQGAGDAQVHLLPVVAVSAPDAGQTPDERERIRAKRRSAFGMYRHLVKNPDDIVVEPLMTDEEQEESYRRKFGPAA